MEDMNFSLDHGLSQRIPLKILIAEDDLISQKLTVSMLNLMGYKVDAAFNGIEVLEILESKEYDMILMDVQMPGLDGIETTEKILEKNSFGKMPYIIAITANVQPGDRERCLLAGMVDFLAKPLFLPELQKMIEKWGSLRN